MARGNQWHVYVDELSCQKGRTMGVYIVSDEGKETYHSILIKFKTMNNEAEYEALLARLAIVRALDVAGIKVKAGSEVVVNQVKVSK